jgi:hypothetical protein
MAALAQVSFSHLQFRPSIGFEEWGMRCWIPSVAGIVLAGLSAGLLAAAKDPNVTIESVTSFPDAVTLRSDRYDTRVSYRVVIKNNTTNALNRSFYSGSVTVDGSATTNAIIELPVFLEPQGVLSCTQSAPTNINCVLGNNGSLTPGSGAAFWITVKAPTAGAKLTLNSTFGGDEGKGSGNGCCDSVASTDTILVDPVIGGTTVKTNARSFILGSGQKIFTGLTLDPNQGPAATADDPWVTIVEVPPFTSGLLVPGVVSALPFTTATLTETMILVSCAPYALAQGCFSSDLAIPGTFNSLRVVIRWDESKIKPGTKPENVKLYYTHDTNLAPVQVQLCGSGQPTPGQPCLESIPIKYSKQSVPAVPANFWGDIEFRVKALDNGRYTN